MIRLVKYKMRFASHESDRHKTIHWRPSPLLFFVCVCVCLPFFVRLCLYLFLSLCLFLFLSLILYFFHYFSTLFSFLSVFSFYSFLLRSFVISPFFRYVCLSVFVSCLLSALRPSISLIVFSSFFFISVFIYSFDFVCISSILSLFVSWLFLCFLYLFFIDSFVSLAFSLPFFRCFLLFRI